MKKYETIAKTLATVDAETIANIINNNDNVDTDALTEFEKLCVLFYNELVNDSTIKKLISKNVNNSLVLDCNLAKSKATDYKVDVFKFQFNSEMIQIYCKRDYCNIYTSCNKAFLNDLHANGFTDKVDKKTNRVKTTHCDKIAYNDLISVLTTVCAIFTK